MKDKCGLVAAFVDIFQMPLVRAARKREALLDIFRQESGGNFRYVYNALKNVSERTGGPGISSNDVVQEIRRLRHDELNKSPCLG
jgi:hypothetical protein